MAQEPVDISPKQDGGVLKKILVEGQGDEVPFTGSKVKVHYTGTLTDGTKFDSSRDRGEPFEFNLGKGSVIKAWDIGVATMKKGERAMLTCAPEYAYGKSGSPPTIPPDSVLNFDVEVISWIGEDLSPKQNGGIERVQIDAGEGYTTPNDGSLVDIHLIGKYEGREFDNREISFNIGEGSQENIVSGVEIALEKFKKGERSRLILKPDYAFGSKGSEQFNIPANATVEFIITLKNFERSKESWSLDCQGKVEQSQLFKEKGTKYFKATKFDLATKMYKKALEYIECEKDEEYQDEIRSLTLSLNLNLSLCHLKLQDYHKARDEATSALQIDSKNDKALFRRGTALLNIGETKLASDDFTKCLEIDQKNTSAKQQLAVCAKIHKEQLNKEKKVYAQMFDKFAKRDAKREENEKKREPNVMSSVGEWGKEDREREPSEFEKENPNILLLNGSGQFKDM